MKTVALVPIKLNSQRLPHKNILPIAGHPLCWHLCNTEDQLQEVWFPSFVPSPIIITCKYNGIRFVNG